ncbi:oligopeptide transporter-like protein [Phyllosticta citriasiana]|uniref:oligopeptide transporter-like protein n=1 Tax=Phyllosticta citriasiana TaxID=595635 RepID=UPI0030FDF211
MDYLPTYLPAYLPTYLPTYLTYLPTYLTYLWRRSSTPSASKPNDNAYRDSPTAGISHRESHDRHDARNLLAERAAAAAKLYLARHTRWPRHRVAICFSNMYFGLQTGWGEQHGPCPRSAGLAWFKLIARYLSIPFSPVENVLRRHYDLGCGFVGVIPALQYLLKPGENGPLDIGLWKLICWSVGICFFGVVFAVPLRREVIIREKLKFPSGTAAALMIGVIHGEDGKGAVIRQDGPRPANGDPDERERLLADGASQRPMTDAPPPHHYPESQVDSSTGTSVDEMSNWRAKVRLLIFSFIVSAVYLLCPQVRDVPILGHHHGPETTLHMLLGAILGWGLLSPLAKSKGWAPGPVSDWETGSKGWIVWLSLAIMLADSLVSLGWLVVRPLIKYARVWLPRLHDHVQTHSWRDILTFRITSRDYDYTALDGTDPSSHADPALALKRTHSSAPEDDAPPEHLISNRTTIIGLFVSLLLSILAVHYVFGSMVPLQLNILSLFLALLLSIMGVRALGETDLNPVSGISKLTQLLIALAIPHAASNPNAVVINLVAGAVSESGALQAGDLMQDLKTGHLLGAAPNAQFWGQMIGSAVGAVLSAVIYKLYTNVYEVPGKLFEVPTGFVWIFTARLVTGKGLPEMVGTWAVGAGVVFALGTAARVWGQSRSAGRGWTKFVPGGIAVAVGMYNVPSFTLARTIGGIISFVWRDRLGRAETPIIVLASGLILGEGLFSIVNLALASLSVPHF